MDRNTRIVLVTNQAPHHLYWCLEMAKDLNVVGVLHPHGHSDSGGLKAAVQQHRMMMYGKRWFGLKVLSLIHNGLNPGSSVQVLKKKEHEYFSYAITDYKETLGEIAHCVGSVNDDEAISLLKRLKPDYVCYLGGDIAKKEALDCAAIATLNYHSGLSPYYNGTKTIFHAVADARPNLAGGTLMYMNERTDGGHILSHYLTGIEGSDTASDLFLKGIIGAVTLYKDFFECIESSKHVPAGVRQGRPFKFVRDIDWIITSDIKLRWVNRSGLMNKYVRQEAVVTHYDLKPGEIDECIKRLVNHVI